MAGSGGGSAPFWGPIDAMHQFCEAKYDVSPYIAEFWNTFSNIPAFIIPGLYALIRGRGALDARLALVWVNMAIVGVGSFLFHLTMRFKCELLDELPMVLLVLSGVFSKDDTQWFTSGRWKALIHTVCIGVCTVGMYLYISQGVYERFLETFTLIIILDLSLALACCARPDTHGSWVAGGCLVAYALLLGSGRLLWEAELRLCPAGRGGRLGLLHVGWHLLAGAACYFGTLADMHIRWAGLGVGMAVDDPKCRWPLIGLLPEAWRRPMGGCKCE